MRATVHNVTDRQTDRQTDVTLMPIADHTVYQYDRLIIIIIIRAIDA